MWQHIHKSADIYGYRAEHATTFYKTYARQVRDTLYDRVNRGTGKRYESEVHACRKDETATQKSLLPQFPKDMRDG